MKDVYQAPMLFRMWAGYLTARALKRSRWYALGAAIDARHCPLKILWRDPGERIAFEQRFNVSRETR